MIGGEPDLDPGIDDNPNNPDGVVVDGCWVERLCEVCDRENGQEDVREGGDCGTDLVVPLVEEAELPSPRPRI